jgi:hypothetical protein
MVAVLSPFDAEPEVAASDLIGEVRRTMRARMRALVTTSNPMESLSLRDLVDDAKQGVCMDPARVDEALDLLFEPIAYRIAQEEVARTRRVPLDQQIINEGGVLRRRLTAIAEHCTRRPSWLQRLEFIRPGEHKYLAAMTVADLRAAAQLRSAAGTLDMAYARTFRALADQIERYRPAAMVGEQFTDPEIERIYDTAYADVERQEREVDTHGYLSGQDS